MHPGVGRFQAVVRLDGRALSTAHGSGGAPDNGCRARKVKIKSHPLQARRLRHADADRRARKTADLLPTHGTNAEALKRKRRAAGVKPKPVYATADAKALARWERDNDRDLAAQSQMYKTQPDGSTLVDVYWPDEDEDGPSWSVVSARSPDVVHGQWLQEVSAWTGKRYPVIGQLDLTAGWQEDGYLSDPDKYVSDHPDARAPERTIVQWDGTLETIGLVWRGPDWPWQ